MKTPRDPVIKDGGPSTATIGQVAPPAERVQIDGAAAANLVREGEGVAGTDSTVVVQSFAEASAVLDAPVVLREVPGPGVGAERTAERVSQVQDRVRDVPGRTAPILPAATLVDPNDVRGRHLVDVATRVSHDGVDYTPDHADPDRRSVLLTFAEYSELVAIGAVIPRSWPEVDDATFDRD